MIGLNEQSRSQVKRSQSGYLDREQAIWALKCGPKEKILLLAMNYLDCWQSPQDAVETLAMSTGMTRLDIQVMLVTRPLIVEFVADMAGESC